MKQCPYCSKGFKTWKSVRGHISNCVKNTGEYFVHQELGPIHHTKIAEYRNIIPLEIAVRNLRDRGFEVPKIWQDWHPEECIQAIHDFCAEYGRIPQQRDFNKTDGKYPAAGTVSRLFGSWNKGIEAASYTPSMRSGLGILTIGKDGHQYLSKMEAYFCDKYLFEQYNYEIEPHYPAPHSAWKYDWYLPTLDLYIELTGGLRPERMREKIAFNEELGRKCLVVNIENINKINLADYA